MSRSLKNASPRIAGLVSAAILGLLVVAAFSVSVISFGGHTYTAELSRSGGIRVGDEVRVAGVGAGEVERVRIEDDHVAVDFRLDDQIELGPDTRAEVKLATLLGNKYLEVVPEGRGELPDGRIPLEHTHVTFDIQSAIEGGGTALEALDADKLRKALSVLADAFDDTPPAVRATLEGLGEVSRSVADRRQDLVDLVDGASTVVRTLQTHSDDLVQIMRQSDLLTTELLRRRQAIHDLIAGSRGLATQLSGLVADGDATLRPVLARLHLVTSMLKARATDLDRGLDALAPTVRFYANATGNGPYIDGVFPYLTPDNALCRTGVISGCR